MRAFLVRLPSGARYWTVLDENLAVVGEADAFLRHLRFGRDCSELTTRSYAGAIALFLRWCARTGRDWHSGIEHLALFITWLRHAPAAASGVEAVPGSGGELLAGPGAAPVRGARRVNLVLTAVRGLVAHAVAAGTAPAGLVPLVYEVADQRDLPAEARGDDGRMAWRLRARHRLREPQAGVDRASDEDIVALLRACCSARDRLIVLLMARAGLRRGEVCGLRRSDVHLLPDSAALGCAVPRAHLHVVRRENPNGAWAKSRRQRPVPLDFLVVQAFDAYEFERMGVPQAAAGDFVVVNLFREPAGAPMPPDAINALVAAASRRAGLARRVTPHQLRHAMASNLADSGAAVDEIAELIGHSSVSFHADLRSSRSSAAAGSCGASRFAPRSCRAGPVTPAQAAVWERAAASPVSGAADDAVAVFERLIDPAFLAEAGWDSRQRLLAPPPEHPLLGRPVCRAPGCQATAFGRARVCQRCQRRLAGAGLGLEAVSELPEPPCRPPSRCAVEGCPRPWKTSGDRLCLTHLRQQREVLKVPLEVFLADPQTRPLPPCGPCQVPACHRDRVGTSGSYCDAHQQRFRAAARAVPGLDEAAWRAAQPAIAQYGQVSLYGLAPLVTAQLLVALQQRTRSSTRTSEKALRLVCEKLRLHQVTTIIPASALDAPLRDLDRNARTLLASLARHAHRALLNPETEKVKDVWDLVAFGRPGGSLPFTDISQRWLREAAKRWAVEELPRRRGRGVGGSLRTCVHSLARLSETLRLREDGGQIPGALGRADIEALLNRLAYQQNAGTLTRPSRVMTCRHLKLVLSRIRAMGLTRPGGPAAGLPDDFTVSTSDIPYLPGHAEPSRDLPPEIMRQLCDQLPPLERQHGVNIRTIVELVIDTGRRPDEICTLAWDCLTRDSDGSPVLIYDNHKAGRMGRRLPVTEATATLITGQKQRTRGRYPATPLDELRLFPALQRNPGGRKPVAGPGLVGRHRVWADSLPPLLLADGTEFPRAKVTLYAYRHTYAQRHADAGVPPDVLRELLDHLNFDTTRQYYRVGEKRRREAVDRLTAVQFDRHGNRIWHQAKALLDSEHARRAVGEVAVPFGGCAEPSNVRAGGHACPYRFRCAGCDHFRRLLPPGPDRRP